jgi:tRNA (mo5U34)-methyltransferase
MQAEELRAKIAECTYWYHKIELAPGVVTPGFDLDDLWANTRRAREYVDYKGKSVLDIASFDGMFSFEAEALGASVVIAADCLYRSLKNLLLCREVLDSKVFPYYNVSAYNLVDRLDVFFDENYDEEQQNARQFDIVQHFGLLYHLRDPLFSLSQARSVLKTGGSIIVETDIVMDTEESFMLFNGLPNGGRVRDNYSVWWAPTRECLFEMLESTLFEVKKDTYSEIAFDVPAKETGTLGGGRTASNRRIGRAAVVAEARESGKSNVKFEREVLRTYRNPGLDLRRLRW